MRPHDDPGHLDFVALSAHKLYAPFGSGALVGCRDAFGAAPDHAGGGTVQAVTLDEIAWAGLPDREEAGTPNLLGAVAFAAAIRRLTEIGLDDVAAHERDLQTRIFDGLKRIDGVTVHGPRDRAATIGVVPFTVAGVHHGLVSAALGYEHGIAVRSGCFCAHPYVARLLGLDRVAVERWMQRVRQGDKRDAPGMVRASLGLYNTDDEVDRLVGAVEQIAAGRIAGEYHGDDHGEYRPLRGAA
jgi:selenocysteine lyase/cysteine desulfurase